MKAAKQETISSPALAVASLFIVWLIASFATTAHADAFREPTNAVAREHYVTGNRLYRVREFEKAVEEYKAGAVREDVPVFYFNLGQCYRQLNRYADALWHYERFLNRGKPTGQPEAVVKKLIARMKDEIEKKAMEQPPVPPQPAPPPQPDAASSGQPLPASLVAAERRRSMPRQRKLAIGVGVAGVAGVGLGVGLGLRAQSFKDDGAEVCPMNPCARSGEANELIERGKTNALYANVAFGIGGTAILGAAVLLITGSQAERKTPAIVPRVSRTFAGVAASLTF